MSPKEKAIELVDKFRIFAHTGDYDYEFYGAKNDNHNAKQCALISVDEIMKAPFENIYINLIPDDAKETDWFWNHYDSYWQEVKTEIENL